MAEPTGRFEGWETYPKPDPFEDHAGPYFYTRDERGVVCAFEAKAHHCNGSGAIHGGALMTFADFSFFAFIKDVYEDRAVTVSFSAEFADAGFEGDLVEARGEVVRETGSLIFLRGIVSTNGRPLLNFSGVVKKMKRSEGGARSA